MCFGNYPICRPVLHCLIDRFVLRSLISRAISSYKAGKQKWEGWEIKQDLRMFFSCIIKRLFFSCWFMYPVSAASSGNEMKLSICPPIYMRPSVGLFYPRGWSIGQEIFIEKILKQKIKFSTMKSSFPDKWLMFSTTNSNFTISFFLAKKYLIMMHPCRIQEKGVIRKGKAYWACPYFVCLCCVTGLCLAVQTPERQCFSFGNF